MSITIQIPTVSFTRLRGPWPFLKRHWKKITLLTVIGVPVVLLLLFIFSPEQPEYVTAVSARGDLVQTVEAVGTVTSERDVELKFPVTGVVAQVLVREGDVVRAGQRLATLRSGSLAASVASASAVLQSEEAELKAMQDGARPEDIAIAEAELQNKRASLEVARSALKTAEDDLDGSQEQLRLLQREAEVSLAGDVSNASSTIAEELTQVLSSLQSVDDVLGDTDVQDVITKHDTHAAQELLGMKERAAQSIRNVIAARATPTDYEEAIDGLSEARAAAWEGARVLQIFYDLLTSLPLTSYYTSSERETHKSTISTESATIQSSVSAIDTSLSGIKSASASYDTKIAAEEASLKSSEGARDKAKADILTYEAGVLVSEAQLALKKAGTRAEDIAAQEARVRQARADLARAAANLSDTVIAAPMDGTITQVNVKVGEYTPAEAAITMLGVSPYRIEMFVSEIDIPKVKLTQSGSIELDAFPGVHFDLRVSEIDPAATDKDGVSKYRVKLDFVYPHDDIKIGMTGDAEMITGMRADVVSVPRRAVLEDDDDREFVRLLLESGEVEERTVVTGMEGGSGDMEIITGLKDGETIIVLEKQ